MIATAVILSFSAFASLRETAAIRGMEKFFTPRRKGAKGEIKTEAALTSGLGMAPARRPIFSHQERKRISVPNLSGFAPLRERAAVKGELAMNAAGRAIEVNRPCLGRGQAPINHQPSTVKIQLWLA
jgi:hypothetical protein